MTTPTLRSLLVAYNMRFPINSDQEGSLHNILSEIIDRLEPPCHIPTTKIRPAPKCDGRLENCKARSMEEYLDGDCPDCSAASCAGAGGTDGKISHQHDPAPKNQISTSTDDGASVPAVTTAERGSTAPADPPAVPAIARYQVWTESSPRTLGAVEVKSGLAEDGTWCVHADYVRAVENMRQEISALRADRDRLQQQCDRQLATITELSAALVRYQKGTSGYAEQPWPIPANPPESPESSPPPGETA